MYVSKATYLWLTLSALIVIFDASYVLLRPESMKGGKYFHIYAPYELYIKFDTLYGLNSDHFVVIQSWLNLAEAFFLLLSVILSLFSSKSLKIKGALLVIIASAFVFWKTVIYIWYDHSFLSPAAQSFSFESLYIFYLPTSFWIIGPLWTIFSVSGNLSSDLLKKEKKA